MGIPTEKHLGNSRRPEAHRQVALGGAGFCGRAGPSLKLACYDLPTFNCPLSV